MKFVTKLVICGFLLFCLSNIVCSKKHHSLRITRDPSALTEDEERITNIGMRTETNTPQVSSLNSASPTLNQRPISLETPEIIKRSDLQESNNQSIDVRRYINPSSNIHNEVNEKSTLLRQNTMTPSKSDQTQIGLNNNIQSFNKSPVIPVNEGNNESDDEAHLNNRKNTNREKNIDRIHLDAEERLAKLKKEEELLTKELKMKEGGLNNNFDHNGALQTHNSNSQMANRQYYSTSTVYNDASHYDSYLTTIPQTYHYQSYYPYYHYYWYFCDDYANQYPQYYNYYTHHHPTVERLNFGPLVLSSGRTLNIFSSHNNINFRRTSMSLRECKNGPRYYFTVKVSGKIFRVFLGDVNDFFNIQCLYMMSAVVSIGQLDHAEKLVEIYDNPMKRVRFGSERFTVNPFDSSKMTPADPNIQVINRNVKLLSFRIENMNLPRKEVVFYHRRDLATSRAEDVFRELSRHSESGNVLYIVDHLQRSSVTMFRHYLIKYRRFTPSHIHRLRYKRFTLFPRGMH